MKKTLIALALLLVAVASQAQGTIALRTKVGTAIDAPITIAAGNPGAGNGAGTVSGIVSQLFLVGAGGALTPLTPTTTYLAANARYVVAVGSIDVPGTATGGSATFRLAAYAGASSYTEATTLLGAWHGISEPFTVSGLGGPVPGQPSATPPNPTGIQGFTIVQNVPEPSTIALLALGGAALMFRRRK